MEGITTTLICSYRPARQPFHPTLVRPVFDKVRVVHTLCPREHPLQIFVQTILQVDTCPHEDHGRKRKKINPLIVEVTHSNNPQVVNSNILRCITFEMEIEVTFEKLEDSISSNAVEFLEAHKPSIKAKLFDWPRRDSDVALVDIAVSTEQMISQFNPDSLEQIHKSLVYLRRNHKEDKVINWRYDPLREGSLKDVYSTGEINKSRLRGILATFTERYDPVGEQPIDNFSNDTLMYCNYWFWKWRVYSMHAVTLIKQREDCADNPEQLADLKERIKQILSLLLNVVKLFQDMVINQLPGLDICESMHELILPYNQMADHLEAVAASDLEDLTDLNALLKKDPIKLVQTCFLTNPRKTVDGLYEQHKEFCPKVKDRKDNWPVASASNCALIYEPLEQVMCGILLSCLKGMAGLTAAWSLWDGPSRTIYSEVFQHSGGERPSVVYHPKILFNLEQLLTIQEIPDVDVNQRMDYPPSVHLIEPARNYMPLKLAKIGKRLAYSGTDGSHFKMWSTDALDSYEGLQEEHFKEVEQIDHSDGALIKLKLAKRYRLDASNSSHLLTFIKLPEQTDKLATYLYSVPADKDSPVISTNLFSLSNICTTSEKECELESIFLNKYNQFFTFGLEEQSGPNKLLMTGHLTAFKLKEANLDLCFSTKIELECPKGARRGGQAKRSSRFFTAGNRMFFIFSVSIHSFVMYTVYQGTFCRVSGGKATDDPASPVYNYPAMTSMLESRDKRGQPGNSLYVGRPTKQTRAEKGQFQVFRMRIKH